jgi:hypothetical protein
VEPEAGQVHVFRLACSIKNGEDIFHFIDMIRADSLILAVFEQPFEPFMPEASNHDLRSTVA